MIFACTLFTFRTDIPELHSRKTLNSMYDISNRTNGTVFWDETFWINLLPPSTKRYSITHHRDMLVGLRDGLYLRGQSPSRYPWHWRLVGIRDGLYLRR
jgi:hypothetical protein